MGLYDIDPDIQEEIEAIYRRYDRMKQKISSPPPQAYELALSSLATPQRDVLTSRTNVISSKTEQIAVNCADWVYEIADLKRCIDACDQGIQMATRHCRLAEQRQIAEDLKDHLTSGYWLVGYDTDWRTLKKYKKKALYYAGVALGLVEPPDALAKLAVAKEKKTL